MIGGGDPWCIRGDFNITEFQSESMGAIRGHSPTWEFSKVYFRAWVCRYSSRKECSHFFFFLDK